MEKHSTTRFFNQLIKESKKNIKNIGIITDKDGTILLNEELKKTLQDFREKNLGVNIYLIANSGRTVQDMINCLKEESIPIHYFDYIIGDNGAMCLDVQHKNLLYKNVMDKTIVSKVIEEFIKRGANFSQIRISDGRNIFAYESEKVKEYYKGKKDIVFKKNISDLENMDITKLTLSGSHEQIDEMNKFIRENIKGYKTHLGKTSFPTKSEDNYRLDFTRYAYKRRCI